MKKPINKKMYNKTKDLYLLSVGGHLTGLFDAANTIVGTVTGRSLDIYKLLIDKEVYIVKFFKRKHCCLMYKLSDNNIDLSNPELFSLPTIDVTEYINLWEEFDI